MKRSTIAVLVLIVAVVVGLLVWLAVRPDTNDSSDSQEQAASETTQPAPAPVSEPAPPQANVVTVAYDNNGFSPTTITVKSGQTVNFANKTSSTIQPSSDPHPQHTDNSELNAGNISGGSSGTITPKRAGSFGMHDHFNPSHTLNITVE